MAKPLMIAIIFMMETNMIAMAVIMRTKYECNVGHKMDLI